MPGNGKKTPEEVKVGEVIAGYRLERLLGSGSTSSVYLGEHTRLGRKAAIKVLAPTLLNDERSISRLLTEARVVNDIRHPNIVDITDFYETEDPRRVALVMEYIEGPSLRELRSHRLTFGQAIGIVIQLVGAVQAAHKAGVVHRDIKPDNLLLTSDPRKEGDTIPMPKIVDFGIAKIAKDAMGHNPATAVMIGTPAYMAPEQIAGSPPPSAKTDVYAIGEVLYELLSGRRAFQDASVSATVRTKLRGHLPDLQIPRDRGERQLMPLIKQTLAQRSEDRPELDDLLQQLVDVCPPAVLGRLGMSSLEEPPPTLDPFNLPTVPMIDENPLELLAAEEEGRLTTKPSIVVSDIDQTKPPRVVTPTEGADAPMLDAIPETMELDSLEGERSPSGVASTWIAKTKANEVAPTDLVSPVDPARLSDGLASAVALAKSSADQHTRWDRPSEGDIATEFGDSPINLSIPKDDTAGLEVPRQPIQKDVTAGLEVPRDQPGLSIPFSDTSGAEDTAGVKIPDEDKEVPPLGAHEETDRERRPIDDADTRPPEHQTRAPILDKDTDMAGGFTHPGALDGLRAESPEVVSGPRSARINEHEDGIPVEDVLETRESISAIPEPVVRPSKSHNSDVASTTFDRGRSSWSIVIWAFFLVAVIGIGVLVYLRLGLRTEEAPTESPKVEPTPKVEPVPKEPEKVRVHVTSTPSGALVRRVGSWEVLGNTPLELLLPPDVVAERLEVSLPGYEKSVVEVSREHAGISVELKRKKRRSKKRP